MSTTPSSLKSSGIRKSLMFLTATSMLWAQVAAATNARQVDQVETSRTPDSIFGDKTEITLGVGPASAPRYLGAKENKTLIVPTLSIYRGIFFADSIRGLGAEYLTESGTYISAALSYDLGRSDKNSDWRPGSERLVGMGEIKSSTLFSILAAQEITPWLSINGDADFRMGGQRDRGNRYRLGLEATLLDTDRDELSLTLSAHGGDRDFNRTYFGVSDLQSQRSRFNAYSPESGIYAGSVTLDWSHEFDKHWTLFGALNVMRFVDEARKSPVVEKRTGVTGTLMINYTF